MLGRAQESIGLTSVRVFRRAPSHWAPSATGSCRRGSATTACCARSSPPPPAPFCSLPWAPPSGSVSPAPESVVQHAAADAQPPQAQLDFLVRGRPKAQSDTSPTLFPPEFGMTPSELRLVCWLLSLLFVRLRRRWQEARASSAGGMGCGSSGGSARREAQRRLESTRR